MAVSERQTQRLAYQRGDALERGLIGRAMESISGPDITAYSSLAVWS